MFWGGGEARGIAELAVLPWRHGTLEHVSGQPGNGSESTQHLVSRTSTMGNAAETFLSLRGSGKWKLGSTITVKFGVGDAVYFDIHDARLFLISIVSSTW